MPAANQGRTTIARQSAMMIPHGTRDFHGSRTNPWQVPMGTTAEAVLRLCGVEVNRVDDAADVERVVERAAERAFGSETAVAVLLSQRLIGRKEWVK